MAELMLSCKELTKGFGAVPLFAGVTFGITEGEHVALVGPNGSGKTTLLRVLAGLEPPDAGVVAARRALVVGYVPQDPTFDPDLTAEEVVLAGLAGGGGEDREKSTRAAIALSQAGFDEAGRRVGTMSGGWRKRLAIAREVARRPDLLLMDEPTNHLDIEGIAWLEGLLAGAAHGFLAVSHDRYFLENVAGRVLELARIWPRGLFEVRGRYSRFLVEKDAALSGLASYQDSLANKVRREIDWLAHKARARTRKGKARVDEAGRMTEELADLQSRAATRTAGIEFSASGRRTRELIVARDVAFGYDGAPVVRGLSLVLSPGTRLGLVGRNGSGKSTVLRLLSGELKPGAGTVERAPHLKVVQFEQDRSALDPTAPLRASLAAHGDSVIYQGRPVHVAAWAKRFLFAPEQLDQPVGRLSGGEQARVLLARLMLAPADVLLLDEPTNDLDIPTLEVLEESLLEFPGALVLVTHDRYLLDRVATRVLALGGKCGAQVYADYGQWEAAVAETLTSRSEGPAGTDSARRERGSEPVGVRRLTYRERQEWDGIEEAIVAGEEALAEATAAAQDPAIASDAGALHVAVLRMDAARAEVERLYARWAELEAKQRD